MASYLENEKQNLKSCTTDIVCHKPGIAGIDTDRCINGIDKAPNLPRAPQQIARFLQCQDFQLFPDKLAVIQGQHKRLRGIPAATREPTAEEGTPEALEQEQLGYEPLLTVGFVVAEPFDDDDLKQKEEYIKQGFPDRSRCDFQQLIRAMETYGWGVDAATLAGEIWDKSIEDVEKYWKVGVNIRKSGKLLSGIMSTKMRYG
ncbi:hypothetical protein B0H34DRAFT_849593 [Crassisporium funariophilum]|nr:hypothetical protein B0H34DRAFT_849593 [Crassisporium funariophilum]